MQVSPDLISISKVLWLAQVFLTLFPAWFLYSLFRQAQRSGYRERSALPFAAALLTWTVAGVINTLSAFSGHMPYWNPNWEPSPSTFYKMLDLARVLLSTINTLFLAIGAVRLDNFPARLCGDFLRRLSNRQWAGIGFLMLAADVLVYIFARGKTLLGLDIIFVPDIILGFLALIPITIGLFKTFLKYEMGKMLTAAIIGALMCLEVVLIYNAFTEHDSPGKVLFLTSILVTSKVAFMIVLVMAAAAWGRYYTSRTVEELKTGRVPERVRDLFEVIPGKDIEYVRRKAYDAILSYWPDSPSLLEAIKTEGPSSREVVAASRNPQMIASLIEAGILNLNLSYVGNSVTNELMSASARLEVNSNGQVRSQTRKV